MDQRTIHLHEGTFTYFGRESDPYFGHAQTLSFDEDALCRFARARGTSWRTIFDVGANIGVTSAMLATVLPHVTIHAYEPGAEALRYLTATAAAAGEGRIRVHAKGLGEEPGLATFHVPGMLAASHIVTEHHSIPGLGSETSEISTLDAEAARLGLDRLDLIKIDVEGFEREVLEGGRSTVAKFRPAVLLEINSFCLVAVRNSSPREFLTYLRTLFPRVSYWRRGEWVEMASGHHEYEFLHEHLVNNRAIDDLLCEFA
jgi:FkbM family methyltransferase